jgi:DNA-binding NarL/FixJ family response regulator
MTLPGISVAWPRKCRRRPAIILRSRWRRVFGLPAKDIENIGGRLKMKGLTKREQQVVAILLEGRSNKEIARRLGITEGTVKLHLHSIFQKTGVIRRVALVAKVMNGRRRSTKRPR